MQFWPHPAPAVSRLLAGIVIFWLLALAGFAQTNKLTTTLDGITFNSDYDNGSLAGISRRATNDYDAIVYTDTGEKGTAKYWFRFSMTNVAGRTVTLHLDHSQNPLPFIRILNPAPGPWRRMTTNEAPDTATIVLNFAVGTQQAELAFFDPLGYAETIAAVTNLIAGLPYASLSNLGQSFEGRSLHLVTVNDTNYPAAGKQRVWVHARVHAGEITATHTMLGMLEQALEDSDTGRRLRQHVIFTFVPQVNVDGIHRGYTRWDSQGIDEESEWCNIRVPEVSLLKGQVDAFMASANPISVALNLHSTMGNFTDAFFFKHLSPSVTTAFEAIQQNYINAVNAATPIFDNLSPQTSQLNACTFIESYFWNNWGESVMAMTQEGHYYRRITDNAWVDGAHYRELGRAMTRALISYYGLPAPNPTNTPPILLSQPLNQLVALGQNLRLSVTSTSSAPVGFQWWFNGTPLPSATNATLISPITQTLQAGAYAVVVTNSSGGVTSAVARVVVVDAFGTPVAFADDFEANTAARWQEIAGYTNGIPDYTANYAFDYSSYFSSFLGTNLPSAPSSVPGTTRGLRLTVNNSDAIPATAAVCLYPKWQSFSGAHALKFDMWLNYPGTAGGIGASGSTEYACFGINTSGNYRNWDSATAVPSDGLWFSVTGEGGAANDYRAHVGGTNNAPVTLSFATSGLGVSGATNASSGSYPYTSFFPAPAYQTLGAPGKHWVQVEVSQDAANVVSWLMNGNLIARRTNSTSFTSGNLMLSFADLFPSIASPAADAFLLYDNVRVELQANDLRPVFTTQPASVSCLVGQSATFSASVSGWGPLAFQWRRDGVPMFGETNSSLTIVSAKVTDVGNYDVQVGNAAGGIASLTAGLSVYPVNTNPAPIRISLATGSLLVSWPSDHTGWRLEMQTNSLGTGLSTNWMNLTAAVTTNQLTLPVVSTGAAFFRLRYP